MRREAPNKLVTKVASLARGVRLIIVGSQSAQGQIDCTPSPVLKSVEADFFFFSDFGRNEEIEDACGPESDFYAEHGIYADPLGIGIVTLPRGWEDRLVPIKDDAGNICWWALEIHDTAASKLMAGRDKDFDFICELTYSDRFNFGTFLERAALLMETAHAHGLRPRAQKLIDRLASLRLHEPHRKTLEFIKTLPL